MIQWLRDPVNLILFLTLTLLLALGLTMTVLGLMVDAS